MGWSGGAANRTWARSQSGASDGRIGARRDVAKILAAFRREHDWRPGQVWNPRTGQYENAS